jgi:hypothetical protein
MPLYLITGWQSTQVGVQFVHVLVLRRIHHFRWLLHTESVCWSHNWQLQSTEKKDKWGSVISARVMSLTLPVPWPVMASWLKPTLLTTLHNWPRTLFWPLAPNWPLPPSCSPLLCLVTGAAAAAGKVKFHSTSAMSPTCVPTPGSHPPSQSDLSLPSWNQVTREPLGSGDQVECQG